MKYLLNLSSLDIEYGNNQCKFNKMHKNEYPLAFPQNHFPKNTINRIYHKKLYHTDNL